MKEFVVRKNMGLTRKFSIEELKEALTDCVRSEEAVKTGIMNDQMAVGTDHYPLQRRIERIEQPAPGVSLKKAM